MKSNPPEHEEEEDASRCLSDAFWSCEKVLWSASEQEGGEQESRKPLVVCEDDEDLWFQPGAQIDAFRGHDSIRSSSCDGCRCEGTEGRFFVTVD